MAGDAFDELIESGRLAEPLARLATDFAFRAGNFPEARESLRSTLAVYLDHAEWWPTFERALASADPLTVVSGVTTQLVEAGVDADEMRVWLNGLHLDLVSQDREADDDVILELLDSLD